MTNKLNRLIKFGILFLFSTLLIWNCQKDENLITQESEGNKHISEISFDELQNKIGSSSIFSKALNFRDNKYSLSNKDNSIKEDFYIGTDFIIMVENPNYVYYTLKLLENNNKQTNEFYNLIFVQEKATENVSSKIIKYIPTNNWLLDQSKPYSGYVELT